MRWIVALMAMPLIAQSGRSVDLSWTDAINPTATQYNVYRADSACSGTPTFTKRNMEPVSSKSYTDVGVLAGTYCYRVTATLDGFPESSPSSATEASVGLVAPGTVTITIRIEITVK